MTAIFVLFWCRNVCLSERLVSTCGEADSASRTLASSFSIFCASFVAFVAFCDVFVVVVVVVSFASVFSFVVAWDVFFVWWAFAVVFVAVQSSSNLFCNALWLDLLSILWSFCTSFLYECTVFRDEPLSESNDVLSRSSLYFVTFELDAICLPASLHTRHLWGT